MVSVVLVPQPVASQTSVPDPGQLDPVSLVCDETGAYRIGGPCECPKDPRDCLPISDVEPNVEAYADFTLNGCEGERSKITKEEIEGGAGGGSAGPLTFVFGWISYTSTDQGWEWSFACTLDVDYIYGVGWGGFDRKVNLYAQVDDSHAEASCYYTGLTSPISDDRCRTGPTTHEGTYAANANGKTWGYPLEGEMCAKADAINEPAHNYHTPLGDLFITVKDPLNTCDVDTIEWTTTSVDIPGILDDLT